MNWIKKASILGIVFFVCIFLVKPIGVSTQYSVLSGIIYNAFDRNLIYEDSYNKSGYGSSNEYLDKDGGKLAKAIEKPLNYDFIFVLSIPLGSLIAKLLIDKRKSSSDVFSKNDINEQEDFIHQGFIIDYGPSFISGFLLLYGARLAGGCTSGHMMSGIMQGSISGYFFAISVFSVAIPTALLVDYIRNKKEEIF